MRLTINLDDDLYAMARAHAFAKKMSISKAVGDLLRSRAPKPPKESPKDTFYIDPITLLPVVPSDHIISEEDIQKSLDDEDLRYSEMGGFVIKPD